MAGKTKGGAVAAVEDEHVFVSGEDVIPTESGAPKSFDIRPDFHTMDEDGIKDYFKELTKYLRFKGAVVRGPEVTSETVESPAATNANRQVSVAPSTAKAKRQTAKDKAKEDKDVDGTTRPTSAIESAGADVEPTDDEGPVEVFECFYEWEYDPKNPLTVRFVSEDRLEAIRGCVDEAFHKRDLIAS